MLKPSGFEIAKKLRHVFVRHRFCSFQFNQKNAFNKKISKKVT